MKFAPKEGGVHRAGWVWEAGMSRESYSKGLGRGLQSGPSLSWTFKEVLAGQQEILK
jgi:hypothetical protein